MPAKGGQAVLRLRSNFYPTDQLAARQRRYWSCPFGGAGGGGRCDLTFKFCGIGVYRAQKVSIFHHHIPFMNTVSLGTRTLKRESAALSTLRRDPRVREWMSIFHRATGLAIRLVAPDMEIDSAKTCGHENRFCGDAGVKGSRICCRTRDVLQRKLRSRLVPQRVVCGTGLTEVAIPVAIHGRHCATFLVGQVFCKKPDARSWARLTALVGEDGEKQRLARLRQAYLDGYVVSDEILTPLIHTVSLHVCRIVNDLWREEAAQRSRRKRRKRTPGRPK